MLSISLFSSEPNAENISIRTFLRLCLQKAVEELSQEYNIDTSSDAFAKFTVKIEFPPRFDMGQYASPAPMELAKIFRMAPRRIAEELLKKLPSVFVQGISCSSLFQNISVAGAGFLNFTISTESLAFFFNDFDANAWLHSLFKKNADKPKVLFEFVSANPTGPLNIVSARAACVGDSICRLLRKVHIPLQAEYYVNDYGNQVSLLGLSFAYRYFQSQGNDIELPINCYQGEYIREMVQEIFAEEKIPAELTSSPQQIEKLGTYLAPLAVQKILDTQKKDLQEFGVAFDNFFSEASLHNSGAVGKAFEHLQESGFLYESEGAYFFRSTAFEDDKDRVVKRSDGRYTYLMADIAYHADKVKRGFSFLYNIWGPDHHGYIARLRGALQAFGFAKTKDQGFEVLIVQQVNMIEDGKPVVMSKRLGKFQTMRDLITSIPVDVSRYFFVSRSQSSHLDFDLDLALTQSNQNPVYYIEYAHARVYSIFNEVEVSPQKKFHLNNFVSLLKDAHRDSLFFLLLQFPDHLEDISANLEIHRLTSYLYNVASEFTSFYHQPQNRVKDVIQNDKEEAELLLYLCQFTAWVLRQGLAILGISAPDRM